MEGARGVRRRQTLIATGEGGGRRVKLTEVGDARVSRGPRAGRGVFGIMGQRRGTPGWEDDPVRRQGRRLWVGRQGRSWFPPRKDIGQKEEEVGRVYV